MKLRPLTIEQGAPLIAESEHSFLPPAGQPDQTASSLFDKLINHADLQIYGYMDDEVRSYITVLAHTDPYTIAIGPMYVAATRRGRGLGLRQVNDFIAAAGQAGYRQAFTKTWLGNIAANRIFCQAGFTFADIKLQDRVDGDATVTYTRSI